MPEPTFFFFFKCNLKCVSEGNHWFWGNEPIQSVKWAFSTFVYLDSNLIIQITQFKIIAYFKSICAPPMIPSASEIFPLLFLQQFKNSFPVDMLPRSSSHPHECTCTHECAHSHIYRVTNANSFSSLLCCQGPPGRPGLPGADGIRGPPGTMLMLPVRSCFPGCSAVWPQGGAV